MSEKRARKIGTIQSQAYNSLVMKTKQVVVIEDDDAIRRGILDALAASGYATRGASNGESGLAEAVKHGVDLVLLDILMPKMDGLAVLKELRKTHPTLPVIILTARGSEDDRVAGLRGGADDYVTKPFSARELLARVEAVLRRSPDRPDPVRSLPGPGGTVDFNRREIIWNDEERTSLSEMEATILAHIAAHPGRVVSRDELLSAVWGLNAGDVETRAIDMHMARLRAKLAKHDPDNKEAWIVTVRGKGYMLAKELNPVME